MNPLLRLLEHGQSYWLDNLTRRMLRDGELERRVREEGLRGVTSNPATFSKAISGGGEYDDQLSRLAREGRGVGEIYEELVVTDIRDACDVLRPVYDESDGADGYVSLEVSPYLAHDTEASVREARRLFRAVDRPNLFIKIPGTPEGVPAIEQLLLEGINVNVTLLFSRDAYEAVARAYLRALERRLEEGRPVDGVASVASFFLSRIDVLLDDFLGHYIRPGGDEGTGPRAQELLGHAAVANAKLAYRRFRQLFSGDRWERLAREGARPQRMLWASTSTKDPLYSDVRYVEPLIGPDTVNTLPERTIGAFADHGLVGETVEEGMEEAEGVMEALAEVGVDFDHVTEQLLHEGVQKFIDPYDRLMAVLARRRRALLGREEEAAVRRPAQAAVPEVDGALESLRARQFGRRLVAGDPSLWGGDSGREDAVRRRLGWLDAGRGFRDRLPEVTELTASLREEGIRDVLLLGMGGSVQAARSLAGLFGPVEGHPALTVLDDTHPGAVRAAEEQVDLERTLFVVASKSGTTVETLSLYRHFLERARTVLGDDVPERFVAVTDPGSPLAEEAERAGFREVFLASPDVGGRYSALHDFGMVPAALAGVPVSDVLESAAAMRAECDPAVPPAEMPGVPLGAALGLAARKGRDKATLFLSDGLAPLLPWLEQLLAESLGKSGTGVVPVAGEQPAAASAYGPDRFFVHLSLQGEARQGLDQLLDELEADGHPVVRARLPGREAVGGELFRWEVATATAGAVLGVNPFDEPDVAEAKAETRKILESGAEDGAGTGAGGGPEDVDGVTVHGGEGWLPADGRGVAARLAAAVEAGDYVAVLPYLPATPARSEALEALRRTLWGRTGAAVTLQHGPGYLHSTGQLHKGGPDTGVFLILTTGAGRDLDVPGRDHSLGALNRAQALADQRILERRGRRVLRLHLDDPDRGLAALVEAFRAPRESLAGAGS